MSPQSATIQPAPVYGRRSRTVTVKPVGAFFRAGSWESERCVFAMQIGSRPRPARSKAAAFSLAAGSSWTSSPPYTFCTMARIFRSIGASSG